MNVDYVLSQLDKLDLDIFDFLIEFPEIDGDIFIIKNQESTNYKIPNDIELKFIEFIKNKTANENQEDLTNFLNEAKQQSLEIENDKVVINLESKKKYKICIKNNLLKHITIKL